MIPYLHLWDYPQSICEKFQYGFRINGRNGHDKGSLRFEYPVYLFQVLFRCMQVLQNRHRSNDIQGIALQWNPFVQVRFDSFNSIRMILDIQNPINGVSFLNPVCYGSEKEKIVSWTGIGDDFIREIGTGKYSRKSHTVYDFVHEGKILLSKGCFPFFCIISNDHMLCGNKNRGYSSSRPGVYD